HHRLPVTAYPAPARFTYDGDALSLPAGLPISLTVLSADGVPVPAFSSLDAPVINEGTASVTISGNLAVDSSAAAAGEIVEVYFGGVATDVGTNAIVHFATTSTTGGLPASADPY